MVRFARFASALAFSALTVLPVPIQAAGVIVVAGGGSEGDIGDTSSWSYKLYKRLVDNGDINGDGRIKVAILSTGVETSWLGNYFVWLGATEAVNIKAANRTEADNATNVDGVKTADVVFLKGGDQGEYYDFWNGTLLEDHIRLVEGSGGAIGGTSAGAMSQSQYCFAGGKDLISLDVLQDAKTPYLDDAQGGSGIHTDFLGFIPGVVIDTHYTTRGRTGRLMGILGKAIQDNSAPGMLAIGIDERTGLIITGNTAQVIGIGSVDFIQQTSSSSLKRDTRRPLYYTNLRLDRLTQDWKYDLAARQPDTSSRPSTAVVVTYAGDSQANSSALVVRGSWYSDEEKLERVIEYDPYPYLTVRGTASPYVRSTFGLTDAQNSDFRGAVHESMFRAMYDFPSYTGFLVAREGQLNRTAFSPDQLAFQRDATQSGVEAATLVIDGKSITYKDLSPYISNVDAGTRTLRAAALINARVHVLAETSSRGTRYNTRTHSLVGNTSR